MKWMKRLCSAALTAVLTVSLASTALAADYSFNTDAPQDYYGDTSYEDIYGSQYNYGGPNVVDFQAPELEYGLFSTTQTGIMEKSMLPGLHAEVAVWDGGEGSYGFTESGGLASAAFPDLFSAPGLGAGTAGYQYQQTAYTSVDGLIREDGSIGTVEIPSLGISMRLWEGETNESMKKGLGHYSSTSAWDGNVGACGHNRGSKYVIGSIKDLEYGAVITYTTVLGTRTYQVTYVGQIDNEDWSYLQSTPENRITITTCLADHPDSRICVQAVEAAG